MNPNENEPWDVRDRTTSYRCQGFRIVTECVELPDDSETRFDYLSEPPSVVILPFTPGGDLIVIDEWRQAVGRWNVGLPAGGTEPEDADLHETAKRELTEETGYVAENVRELTAFEPANGVADIVHHYFVATDCRPKQDPSHDPDETIEVRTTAFEDLLEAAKTGELRDGRTVLGLLYYAQTETSS